MVSPAWCIVHVGTQPALGSAPMSGFYDIKVPRIDGTPALLGTLRGKVTLAVNVASRCGLTPQYQGLEELQRELAAENFTVVGFPCNHFAGHGAGGDGG